MTRTIVRHLHPAVVAGSLLLSLVPWTGAHAAPALQVHDLRVGEHPGSTRVVLDISQPGEMAFNVAEDGRSISVEMPGAEWKAGGFAPRHAKGLVRDFRFAATSSGGQLRLATSQPVKIKAPFFVSPEGKQGHRVVIDIVPDPAGGGTIAAAAPRAAPMPVNQPLAQALAATPSQEPPRDVAMVPRAPNSPPSAAPVASATGQSAGQAMMLAPGAARAVETAQAMPPRPQQQPMPQQPMPQPMDDVKGPFGGLFYLKLGAGMAMLEEADVLGTGNNATVETDLGWAVSGGLGLDFKNNFRLEGETFYTSNSVKSVTGTVGGASVNSSDTSGDVSTLAFMANVAYDFVNPYAITPYIFGGGGLAMVSAEATPPSNTGWDDSDWVFALQAGAGAAFDVSDRLTLDVSYRYFETAEPELADNSGTPFNYENAMHMILFGMRYKF